MLLAIDVDVIFFLLVAAIGLINQAFQKTKKIRAESLRQKKHRESKDRVDSPQALEATREDRPTSMLDLTQDLREKAEAALEERGSAVEARKAAVPKISALDRMEAVKRVRQRSSVPRAKKVAVVQSIGSAIANRIRENPATLKEAVVLREILGPPVAHRGPLTRRTR
jgi:hypothetical protein